MRSSTILRCAAVCAGLACLAGCANTESLARLPGVGVALSQQGGAREVALGPVTVRPTALGGAHVAVSSSKAAAAGSDHAAYLGEAVGAELSQVGGLAPGAS